MDTSPNEKNKNHHVLQSERSEPPPAIPANKGARINPAEPDMDDQFKFEAKPSQLTKENWWQNVGNKKHNSEEVRFGFFIKHLLMIAVCRFSTLVVSVPCLVKSVITTTKSCSGFTYRPGEPLFGLEDLLLSLLLLIGVDLEQGCTIILIKAKKYGNKLHKYDISTAPWPSILQQPASTRHQDWALH